MPGPLPAVLDHVAHAVERWEQAWPRYVEALGAQWVSGGRQTGFAPAQLRFANDAHLEVLAPHDTADNPFLRRFLDRHGPGPHHLTFKVPDLGAALAAMAGHGLQPVNVDRSDPDWQEAFVHPRQAGGIVVQVAQAGGEWGAPEPEGFPAPAGVAASLLRATHVVADLAAAESLFVDLLGGTPRHHVAGHLSGSWPAGNDGLDVVDLTWPGPLALRLVGPTGTSPTGTSPLATSLPEPLASWLAGAPGRLHHIALEHPDPSAVPGAVPLSANPAHAADPDGAAAVPGILPADRALAVVPPEENLGLRLVICAPTL